MLKMNYDNYKRKDALSTTKQRNILKETICTHASHSLLPYQ